MRALAALALIGSLLVSAPLLANGEGGLSKGQKVLSASFCFDEGKAREIGKILKTSKTKESAGRLLVSYFNPPATECHILPAPVYIVVEDVIDSGIDVDNDTFYVTKTTAKDGTVGYFFVFVRPS